MNSRTSKPFAQLAQSKSSDRSFDQSETLFDPANGVALEKFECFAGGFISRQRVTHLLFYIQLYGRALI